MRLLKLDLCREFLRALCREMDGRKPCPLFLSLQLSSTGAQGLKVLLVCSQASTATPRCVAGAAKGQCIPLRRGRRRLLFGFFSCSTIRVSGCSEGMWGPFSRQVFMDGLVWDLPCRHCDEGLLNTTAAHLPGPHREFNFGSHPTMTLRLLSEQRLLLLAMSCMTSQAGAFWQSTSPRMERSEEVHHPVVLPA